MPHFWNNTNILVVTIDELVPAHFSSLGCLQVAINRAEKRGYGIRRVQKGGNGRQLLIDFDSLPESIRQAIGDPRIPGHIMELYYKADPHAVDFYTNFKFENNTYLSDEARERYITNASVLKALMRLKLARERERQSKVTKGGAMRGLWASLASDCTSFNSVLKEKFNLEHSLPSHELRLRERFTTFVKEGYESLINKNHGNQSAKKVTDDLVELLNNLFVDRKPTYEEVARIYEGFLNGYVQVVNTVTGEDYDPKNFAKIGKSTIYNYLSSWKNSSAASVKRLGDRQVHMSKYKPPHSLNQPNFAGSILSIDDRQPPFEYAKGERLWFYNGIDLGSQAFTVWVWGRTKEGIILDFYRQMVRNYHEWGICLPDELECESALNSSFKDTFLQEGIMFNNVRIEANNARGKRIEGFWRQLRYGLEKKREGWLARPFARAEANQAGTEKVPMIPYDELVEASLRDIETWNNMPHNKFPEMTRWEYFVSKQNPQLKPTNYKAILPLLGFKTATSVKTGIIRLQGKDWLLGDNGEIYFGQKLINLMTQVEGKDVDVYWLDANDGSIIKALVYLGDKLICEAIEKPSYSRAKIEQTPEDLQKREAMSKYVATISGFINRGSKAIDEVIVIDNRPVTLNNKFQIKGIRRRPTQDIPLFDEVEEMPDPVADEDDIFNQLPTKRSLKDRF